jgi:hypothetical protein
VFRGRPVVGWLDGRLLPGANLLVIQRAGRAHFIGGRERYGFGAESPRRCGARAGAAVGAFALRAEQDQAFDRVVVGAAEPVWGVRVELGDFAGVGIRNSLICAAQLVIAVVRVAAAGLLGRHMPSSR